jgi:hypothetical protein
MRMRVAIGAMMMFCGFVPAGQARVGTPGVQHARQGDAVCGSLRERP